MASVQKSELPSGAVRYVVHYRSPDGRARKKSFKLRRDANNFRTEIEASKTKGTFVDPARARATVGQVAGEWLAGKANVAASTRERYQDIVNTHVLPKWGDVPLQSVRHGDVQKWVSGIDRAPATVVKIHRVFSQILGYAMKDERLSVNPAKGVSLPRPQAAEKRYLTHQQVEALATACGDWGLIVRFLAYTGLRWGELAALRVKRLDFDARRITVAESVTPVEGKMIFSDTKGHESRRVPMPVFLIGDLLAQVEGKEADDLVFTGPRGAVLRAQVFQRAALRDAAISQGLATAVMNDADEVEWTDVFHPHELRHTAASLAIASGANVKIVQNMLGHKSATMTLDQYGHLFPDSLDEVASAVEAARAAALSNPVAADLLPIR